MSTLTLQVNVHTHDPDKILCAYRRNRFGAWEPAIELANSPGTTNPLQLRTENSTLPLTFKFILRDSVHEHCLRITFHNGEMQEEKIFSAPPRRLQATHQDAIIDWHL